MFKDIKILLYWFVILYFSNCLSIVFETLDLQNIDLSDDNFGIILLIAPSKTAV